MEGRPSLNLIIKRKYAYDHIKLLSNTKEKNAVELKIIDAKNQAIKDVGIKAGPDMSA